MFLITAHIYPPHFDKKSNKISLLLAYSTVYIFGTAIFSYAVNNKDDLLSNVLPFFLPLFLVLGTVIIYREDLWARHGALFTKKRQLHHKRLWLNGEAFRSSNSNKVGITSMKDNDVSRKGDDRLGTSSHKARGAGINDQARVSSIIKLKVKQAYDNFKVLGKNITEHRPHWMKDSNDDLDGFEEASSSEDEDGTTRRTAALLLKERGRQNFGKTRKHERRRKRKPIEAGRKKGKSFLQRAAYQLSFFTLLACMALLVNSGFAFFYGASYDSRTYLSQPLLSVGIAVSKILT